MKSRAISGHTASVTCHPAALTFFPVVQPKLVLDLTILEGCKAELTWVVVTYPKIVYLWNTVTYHRDNWAVSWRGTELTTSVASPMSLPLQHRAVSYRPSWKCNTAAHVSVLRSLSDLAEPCTCTVYAVCSSLCKCYVLILFFSYVKCLRLFTVFPYLDLGACVPVKSRTSWSVQTLSRVEEQRCRVSCSWSRSGISDLHSRKGICTLQWSYICGVYLYLTLKMLWVCITFILLHSVYCDTNISFSHAHLCGSSVCIVGAVLTKTVSYNKSDSYSVWICWMCESAVSRSRLGLIY